MLSMIGLWAHLLIATTTNPRIMSHPIATIANYIKPNQASKPWPVAASIAKASRKPTMAARPFRRSA
jgi:hypothetical protein